MVGMNFDQRPLAKLTFTLLSRRPTAESLTVALAILLLCFLSSWLYWEKSPLAPYLAATGQAVFERGEYWRLITTQWVHGDVQHLLSNSFLLGILGTLVHAYYGFKIFPWLTLLGSAVMMGVSLHHYEPHVTLVGASGWVYFLAGFWLVLFFLIERQRSLRSRWIRVLGVGAMILLPSTFQEQVSYVSHFWGAVGGVVLGLFYFQFNKFEIRRAEVWEMPSQVEEFPPEEDQT